MKRHSPKEPCPSCSGRAWLWNDDYLRWKCEGCDGRVMKDFEAWYKSAMDDWETCSRMLADLDREPEPEAMRDRLIQEARRMKLEQEYKRVDALAQTASSLKLMVDWISHGEFHIKFPSYDIEVSHEW